jgi:O-succinylbenzoic acid--CoA ligase
MDSIRTLFPYNDTDLIDQEMTYAEFLNLVEKFKIDPASSIEVVGIKACSPLEFLAKILAVLLSGKKALLLPKNLYAFELNQLKDTIDFTFIEKIKAFPHANQLLFSEAEIIFLSSGSTSTPVGYGHRLMSFHAHINLFQQFFNPQANELYAMNLPLNHVGGLMLLWRALSFKGRITSEIDHLPIDYLSLVPVQVEKMLQDIKGLEQLQKVKALFVGGGIINPNLRLELEKNQIAYYETYGMTETLSFVALNQKILTGISVKTLEDQSIVIDSPTLFFHSYKNKKMEMRNQQYITGDLGEVIDNELKFIGRKDKVFKSGGEKVSKSEVEDLLFKHTKLSSFIVGSVKDLKWEEMILALIENDVDNEELREKLKKVAPSHKIPRFFLKKNPKLLNGIKITQKDIYKHYLYSIFDHQFIDRQKNETIVVFHGFMETYDDFKFLENHFQNYNFLFINLPGHGKTKLSKFYSLADLEAKLNDFLLFFSGELILFGYSMGGRVASLMTKLPHLKALILISSGIGLNSDAEKLKRLNADHELFSRFQSQADFFKYWYAQKIFGSYQKTPVYLENINNKLSIDLKTIDQSLNLLSPGVFPLRESNTHSLNNFLGKKFYIYGELDEKYAALKNDYQKLQFELVEVKNAYHNLHKTHESELIDCLQRFL